MEILGRSKLIECFESGELQFETDDDHIKASSKAPHDFRNFFQQCSVDLRVGEIYIPGVAMGKPGSAVTPSHSYILKSGYTILVRTKEKIKLPANIGGICFSPSRLSLKGLLITNMGHVDPGYHGCLHFTAINMGKEDFVFREGDMICTMLLFRLNEEAPPFGDEHIVSIFHAGKDHSVPAVVKNYLPNLSHDFINVEGRAKKITERIQNKTVFWQYIVPGVLSVVSAVIVALITFLRPPLASNVTVLEARMQLLESQLEVRDEVRDIRTRVENIEDAEKRK